MADIRLGFSFIEVYRTNYMWRKSASLQLQKHRPASFERVWERVRERNRERVMREPVGSVDSMGESLGIRVLLSSSLRQILFEINDDFNF
jgi:hypothetical protein